MSGLSLSAAELKQLGKRVVNGVAVPIDWVEHPPSPACMIIGKHAECGLGAHSPLRHEKKAVATERTGPKYRSKGEASYGGRLYVLERAGDILEWRYEAVRLRLGEDVTYLADFYIRARDNVAELHEVKGPFAYEDARVKLQVAAAMYPMFRFFLVRTKRGAVESITRIPPLTQAAA